MVSTRTKMRGARKVKRKPTRKGSMNWEREMRRKNKLKKNLNWLKRTTGMKLSIEYFWLDILLDVYLCVVGLFDVNVIVLN